MRQLSRILVSAALVGAVLAALAPTPAQASLRRPNLTSLNPGGTTVGTQSELWFSVWDATNEVSYSLDLGVTVAMLLATNADQGGLANLQTAGNNASATFQKASDTTNDYAFWIVTPTKDAAWSQFSQAASNVANAKWMVMGADSVGSNTVPKAQRFLMTVQQGDEAKIRSTNNQTFSTLRTAVHNMAGALNLRPGHLDPNITGSDSEAAIAFNGSSFDTKVANPTAYFDTFGKQLSTFSVNTLNTVGQSAWFYDLYRNGSDLLTTVGTDEFDNLAGDAYWGFAAEDGNTGRYLLSFVMPRFLSRTEVTAGVTFDNNFARLAGVLSLAAPTADTSDVLGLTEGFLRRLAQRKTAQGGVDNVVTRLSLPTGGEVLAVTVVPEPSSMALWGLGLAVMATLRRRQSI